MKTTLKRQLGTFDGCAIIVASMVGAGIFSAAAYSAEGITSPLLLLGLWVVGGLYSLCGALCYAELGTLFPEAGGEYVYLREAYGKPVAFLSGWISFIAGFSGAIAAFSVMFIDYIGGFFPDWDMKAKIWEWTFRLSSEGEEASTITWDFTWGRFAGIFVVIGTSLIHMARLKIGMRYQNILTAGKVLAMVVFVVAGLFCADRSNWENITVLPDQMPGFGVLAASIAMVLFSFSGWNAAGYIAEEMKDPRRTIAKSLIIGTVLVTVLYFAFILVYALAIPLENFAVDNRIGARAAHALFGGTWGKIATGVFSVLLLATISANIITGPRVYFAMTRDGLFPRALSGGVNKWGVPQRAILFQCVVASLLLVAGGFQQLVYWVGFVINVFATVAVFSVVVLRFKHPKRREGAFSVPLYPLPVIVFCVISGYYSYYIFDSWPETSRMGVWLIAAGLLIYLVWYFIVRPLARWKERQE